MANCRTRKGRGGRALDESNLYLWEQDPPYNYVEPVGYKHIVVVYLLHYISARAHYSRVHSTTVPSVACQTTEVTYRSSYLPSRH